MSDTVIKAIHLLNGEIVIAKVLTDPSLSQLVYNVKDPIVLHFIPPKTPGAQPQAAFGPFHHFAEGDDIIEIERSATVHGEKANNNLATKYTEFISGLSLPPNSAGSKKIIVP